MGMFKDMLGNQESLFRDHVPLDYDYIPKLVPYREQEQMQIAMCIKPLVAQRNGRNIFIYGQSGIGKTVAVKHLLRELEEGEETCETVIPIYINCWQKNTSFKLILEICEFLNYKFTHNKRGEELFKIAKDMINKKSVVLVLDEVDKLEDPDFIYQFIEEVYKKSLVLITNHKSWILELDSRIKSRLMAEMLEFRKYNKEEIRGIMQERMKYAFAPDVWDNEVFEKAVEKAHETGDIRAGLYLLKEAGNAAEDCASKKITEEHMAKAISKLEEFYIKKKEDLEDETRFILDIIKANSGKKIGDLFKVYQESGGASVYKTFQRKISRLSENKYLTVKKLAGGSEGNTTMVSYSGRGITTLDDFNKQN